MTETPRRTTCKAPPLQGRVALAALLMAAMAGDATAEEPRVPPGRDPGGTPIALLTTGLDYTRPDIAARLARDGEGELIGWDLIDNDRKPYAAEGTPPPMTGRIDGTRLARDLTAYPAATPPFSLVPVRVDPGDPVSFAKALAFVAQTPARTVLVPFWSAKKEDWAAFALAAGKFASLQIVVPGCAHQPRDGNGPVYPKDLGLANVWADPASLGVNAEWASHIARLPCPTAPAEP